MSDLRLATPLVGRPGGSTEDGPSQIFPVAPLSPNAPHSTIVDVVETSDELSPPKRPKPSVNEAATVGDTTPVRTSPAYASPNSPGFSYRTTTIEVNPEKIDLMGMLEAEAGIVRWVHGGSRTEGVELPTARNAGYHREASLAQDLIVRVASSALPGPVIFGLEAGKPYETEFTLPGCYTFEVFKSPIWTGSFAVRKACSNPIALGSTPKKSSLQDGGVLEVGQARLEGELGEPLIEEILSKSENKMGPYAQQDPVNISVAQEVDSGGCIFSDEEETSTDCDGGDGEEEDAQPQSVADISEEGIRQDEAEAKEPFLYGREDLVEQPCGKDDESVGLMSLPAICPTQYLSLPVSESSEAVVQEGLNASEGESLLDVQDNSEATGTASLEECVGSGDTSLLPVPIADCAREFRDQGRDGVEDSTLDFRKKHARNEPLEKMLGGEMQENVKQASAIKLVQTLSPSMDDFRDRKDIGQLMPQKEGEGKGDGALRDSDDNQTERVIEITVQYTEDAYEDMQQVAWCVPGSLPEEVEVEENVLLQEEVGVALEQQGVTKELGGSLSTVDVGDILPQQDDGDASSSFGPEKDKNGDTLSIQHSKELLLLGKEEGLKGKEDEDVSTPPASPLPLVLPMALTQEVEAIVMEGVKGEMPELEGADGKIDSGEGQREEEVLVALTEGGHEEEKGEGELVGANTKGLSTPVTTEVGRVSMVGASTSELSPSPSHPSTLHVSPLSLHTASKGALVPKLDGDTDRDAPGCNNKSPNLSSNLVNCEKGSSSLVSSDGEHAASVAVIRGGHLDINPLVTESRQYRFPSVVLVPEGVNVTQQLDQADCAAHHPEDTGLMLQSSSPLVPPIQPLQQRLQVLERDGSGDEWRLSSPLQSPAQEMGDDIKFTSMEVQQISKAHGSGHIHSIISEENELQEVTRVNKTAMKDVVEAGGVSTAPRYSLQGSKGEQEEQGGGNGEMEGRKVEIVVTGASPTVATPVDDASTMSAVVPTISQVIGTNIFDHTQNVVEVEKAAVVGRVNEAVVVAVMKAGGAGGPARQQQEGRDDGCVCAEDMKVESVLMNTPGEVTTAREDASDVYLPTTTDVTSTALSDHPHSSFEEETEEDEAVDVIETSMVAMTKAVEADTRSEESSGGAGGERQDEQDGGHEEGEEKETQTAALNTPPSALLAVGAILPACAQSVIREVSGKAEVALANITVVAAASEVGGAGGEGGEQQEGEKEEVEGNMAKIGATDTPSTVAAVVDNVLTASVVLPCTLEIISTALPDHNHSNIAEVTGVSEMTGENGSVMIGAGNLGSKGEDSVGDIGIPGRKEEDGQSGDEKVKDGKGEVVVTGIHLAVMSPLDDASTMSVVLPSPSEAISTALPLPTGRELDICYSPSVPPNDNPLSTHDTVTTLDNENSTPEKGKVEQVNISQSRAVSSPCQSSPPTYPDPGPTPPREILVEVVNMGRFMPSEITICVGSLVKFIVRAEHGSEEHELEGRSSIWALRFESGLLPNNGDTFCWCPKVPGSLRVRSNVYRDAQGCQITVLGEGVSAGEDGGVPPVHGRNSGRFRQRGGGGGPPGKVGGRSAGGRGAGGRAGGAGGGSGRGGNASKWAAKSLMASVDEVQPISPSLNSGKNNKGPTAVGVMGATVEVVGAGTATLPKSPSFINRTPGVLHNTAIYADDGLPGQESKIPIMGTHLVVVQSPGKGIQPAKLCVSEGSMVTWVREEMTGSPKHETFKVETSNGNIVFEFQLSQAFPRAQHTFVCPGSYIVTSETYTFIQGVILVQEGGGDDPGSDASSFDDEDSIPSVFQDQSGPHCGSCSSATAVLPQVSNATRLIYSSAVITTNNTVSVAVSSSAVAVPVVCHATATKATGSSATATLIPAPAVIAEVTSKVSGPDHCGHGGSEVTLPMAGLTKNVSVVSRRDPNPASNRAGDITFYSQATSCVAATLPSRLRSTSLPEVWLSCKDTNHRIGDGGSGRSGDGNLRTGSGVVNRVGATRLREIQRFTPHSDMLGGEGCQNRPRARSSSWAVTPRDSRSQVRLGVGGESDVASEERKGSCGMKGIAVLAPSITRWSNRNTNLVNEVGTKDISQTGGMGGGGDGSDRDIGTRESDVATAVVKRVLDEVGQQGSGPGETEAEEVLKRKKKKKKSKKKKPLGSGDSNLVSPTVKEVEGEGSEGGQAVQGDFHSPAASSHTSNTTVPPILSGAEGKVLQEMESVAPWDAPTKTIVITSMGFKSQKNQTVEEGTILVFMMGAKMRGHPADSREHRIVVSGPFETEVENLGWARDPANSTVINISPAMPEGSSLPLSKPGHYVLSDYLLHKRVFFTVPPSPSSLALAAAKATIAMKETELTTGGGGVMGEPQGKDGERDGGGDNMSVTVATTTATEGNSDPGASSNKKKKKKKGKGKVLIPGTASRTGGSEALVVESLPVTNDFLVPAKGGDSSGLEGGEYNVVAARVTGVDRLVSSHVPVPVRALAGSIASSEDRESIGKEEQEVLEAGGAVGRTVLSHKGFAPDSLEISLVPGLGALVWCELERHEKVAREVRCQPVQELQGGPSEGSDSRTARLAPGCLRACHFVLRKLGRYRLVNSEVGKELIVVVGTTKNGGNVGAAPALLSGNADVGVERRDVVTEVRKQGGSKFAAGEIGVDMAMKQVSSQAATVQCPLRREGVDQEGHHRSVGRFHGNSRKPHSAEEGKEDGEKRGFKGGERVDVENAESTSVLCVDADAPGPVSEDRAITAAVAVTAAPDAINVDADHAFAKTLQEDWARSGGDGAHEDNDEGKFVQQKAHIKRSKRKARLDERAAAAAAAKQLEMQEKKVAAAVTQGSIEEVGSVTTTATAGASTSLQTSTTASTSVVGRRSRHELKGEPWLSRGHSGGTGQKEGGWEGGCTGGLSKDSSPGVGGSSSTESNCHGITIASAGKDPTWGVPSTGASWSEADGSRGPSGPAASPQGWATNPLSGSARLNEGKGAGHSPKLHPWSGVLGQAPVDKACTKGPVFVPGAQGNTKEVSVKDTVDTKGSHALELNTTTTPAVTIVGVGDQDLKQVTNPSVGHSGWVRGMKEKSIYRIKDSSTALLSTEGVHRYSSPFYGEVTGGQGPSQTFSSGGTSLQGDGQDEEIVTQITPPVMSMLPQRVMGAVSHQKEKLEGGEEGHPTSHWSVNPSTTEIGITKETGEPNGAWSKALHDQPDPTVPVPTSILEPCNSSSGAVILKRTKGKKTKGDRRAVTTAAVTAASTVIATVPIVGGSSSVGDIDSKPDPTTSSQAPTKCFEEKQGNLDVTFGDLPPSISSRDVNESWVTGVTSEDGIQQWAEHGLENTGTQATNLETRDWSRSRIGAGKMATGGDSSRNKPTARKIKDTARSREAFAGKKVNTLVNENSAPDPSMTPSRGGSNSGNAVDDLLVSQSSEIQGHSFPTPGFPVVAEACPAISEGMNVAAVDRAKSTGEAGAGVAVAPAPSPAQTGKLGKRSNTGIEGQRAQRDQELLRLVRQHDARRRGRGGSGKGSNRRTPQPRPFPERGWGGGWGAEAAAAEEEGLPAPSEFEVESASIMMRRYHTVIERMERGKGDLLPDGTEAKIFDLR